MQLSELYMHGTAIWYLTRGTARLTRPYTVFDWFRNGFRAPNGSLSHFIRL